MEPKALSQQLLHFFCADLLSAHLYFLHRMAAHTCMALHGL